MLACANPNGLPVLKQVVSLLLDHGAEVNQQDFFGRTALHHAFKSVNNNNRLSRKQRVEILIERNANIDLKDSFGLSALNMATHKGLRRWLKPDQASCSIN
jgi:ankyrin repeat protein